MATQWQFDASGVAPDTGREVLPEGWYNAVVCDTEIKSTASNNGGYLMAAQLEIVDGFAKGRKVFNNYNIKNPNPTAEKIGLSQLSALMHAMQYTAIQQHTGELHGKPFKVKLKITPAKYKKDANGNATAEVEYEPRNEVVSYKMMSEQVQMATDGGGGAAAPAGLPTGFGAPPAPAAAPAAAAPATPAGFGAPAAAAAAPAAAAAAPAAAPAAVTQPWDTPAGQVTPATDAPAAAAAAPAPTVQAPWAKPA